MIFRALFFEHDAEIGQKDHFGTGTSEDIKPAGDTSRKFRTFLAILVPRYHQGLMRRRVGFILGSAIATSSSRLDGKPV